MKDADQLDAEVRLARLRNRMFRSVPVPRIGPYEVREKLGEGGMGVVYAGWDPGLDRLVALKLLRDTDSEAASARLEGEAVALARLRHPNVVTVYSVGRHEGRVYIAMEHLHGRTLRAALADEREPTRILAAFLQVGRGLMAAHAAGLVHRDVKPDNVIVEEDGRVCLVDFGLARPRPEHVDTAELDPGETHPGAGTVGYLAPELLEGGSATSASDQYAFCVSLHELLAGGRPISDAVSVIPGVPSAVRRMLARGLSEHPSRRWPAMADVVAVLERAVHPRPWRPAVLVAAAGGALAVLAFVDTGDPCIDARDRLGAAWDPARRDAVASSLDAAEHPEASEAILGALDSYAEGWIAARTNACREAESEPERTFELRTRCLERRSADLDALSGTLAERPATADALPGVLRAVGELESVDACWDGAYLESAVLVPADAGRRAEVTRGRVALAQAKLRFAFEHVEVEELDALLQHARPIGFAPFTAEVLNTMAATAQRRGDLVRSEELAVDVLDIAEAEGMPIIAASAWIRLVNLVATGGDEERLQFMTRRATAAVQHAGDYDTQWAALHYGVGLGLYRQHQAAEALERFDRALSLMPKAHSGDALTRADMLSSRAVALMELGDPDAGLQSLDEASEACASVLGRGHGYCARHDVNRASLQATLGRIDDAEATIEAVLSRVGDDDATRGFALRNRATFRRMRGDKRAAAEDARAALEIIERAQGPDTTEARMVRQLLASLLRESGRCEDALPLLDQSLLHPYRGRQDEVVVTTRLDRASCRLGLGRPGALEDITAALGILEGRGDTTSPLYGAAIVLRARARIDDDPEAVRADITTARTLVSDPVSTRILDELQAQLDG